MSPCRAASDGVLLVDSGLPRNADKLSAEVRKLSKAPIRYLINTHVHPDHVGGNEKIVQAGSTITGGNVTGDIADAGVGATIIAHRSGSESHEPATGNQAPCPPRPGPTIPYFTRAKRRSSSTARPSRCSPHPAAHTDGDSIVFFRRSDVISTGDLLRDHELSDHRSAARRQHPRHPRGAESHDRHQRPRRQAGRRHLRDSRPRPRLPIKPIVVEYRDMITIIRDRIAGRREERPDARTGEGRATDARLRRRLRHKPGGFWTTDKFIEAVYKSLSAEKVGIHDESATSQQLLQPCVGRRGPSQWRNPAAAGPAAAPLRPRTPRPKTSPATGSRSSPKTGAGAW